MPKDGNSSRAAGGAALRLGQLEAKAAAARLVVARLTAAAGTWGAVLRAPAAAAAAKAVSWPIFTQASGGAARRVLGGL